MRAAKSTEVSPTILRNSTLLDGLRFLIGVTFAFLPDRNDKGEVVTKEIAIVRINKFTRCMMKFEKEK